MSGLSQSEETSEDVFARLYRRHYADVLAYAARRTAGAEPADIAAETFLVAWRKLTEAVEGGLPWLYRTAAFVMRNASRAEMRRGNLVTRLSGQPAVAVRDHADGYGERDAVMKALKTLFERDRELVLLVEWEELDVGAAARVLGCTVGAARVRLHRARRQVARQLSARAGDEPEQIDGDVIRIRGATAMTWGRARTRQAVRESNPFPVTEQTRGTPVGERAERDLRDILSRSAVSQELTAATPGRTRRPQRYLLAAVAAVMVAAGIYGVDATGAHRASDVAAQRATPLPLRYELTAAVSSHGLLRDIAARASRRLSDVGQGQYARVMTQSWSSFTRVQGSRVTSGVVPTQEVRWVKRDGSGKSITRTGREEREEQDTAVSLMWPLGSLSSDDSTLARQLEAGHPPSNGPAERLMAVHDAYQQMPLEPAVRAAMLRYLAATPGLAYAGQTVDRAGRPAEAFSVDSDYSGLPTRYTVLIDAQTGALLDFEEMLTTSAGGLNVPIPSVISYLLVKDARYVNTIQ